MNVSTCRDQCWQQQGGAGCCSSFSFLSSLTTDKLMMDAREGALVAIGDAATYAHIKNKIAPAAEKPSAPMRANGAVPPTAPTAIV